MKEIDARGLACPAPVLQAKSAIENEAVSKISILVDNEAAKQNVSRFLSSKGYVTDTKNQNQDFLIIGEMENPQAIAMGKIECLEGNRNIMVMVATDRMGFGDETLGKKLMINFIKTLKEMGKDLWRVVFVNNGVKLSVNGSESLEDLLELQDQGVVILVCGTCLTHFNLLDQKQVGETTNMLDIVTAMQLADKVINI
ncbi:MAG: sulfurtransferase-like selenium metabolism protein YedF [Desulfobacteraceae bacterium]|nr:sulfurtransferase-like selenium metabolism protein YedF [Desulfobacteraceae bacterium]MBU4001484.1 sulfurtransferase-like selenium metabolism protein YedF [Pseudomonadota bacterium]MBU4055319.1 sulfurtransferase-like selenium metabolism protein YedF [Pseudomonadota bacterium]